ncbi:hypothetical protein HN51_012756 [Arachis hypogaea]|uniref:Meiosis 1 arrest protein n=1 Tax=Arachis hypogaea TaxID=3818 RepID=A0A445DT34_ARAHY|nr:hypothetical protein Ahy_A03g012323 [Arachis hypogaea]
MVQVCFVLDLRSLAPPLLRDLKQSLLQLANFYAVSTSSSLLGRKSTAVTDKIGLCYVFKNRLSSSDDLKIAYTPRGNFNLRDFHHAVNNLPSDAFLPDAYISSDVMISKVLSDKVLYSWQGKDIERKVIFVTSSLPEDVDSIMQKSLMDAADKCVSVDFAVFQQKSSHLTDTRENIHNFRRSISHLDNCSIQTYIPDFRVLHSLVKKWLRVLKDDMEEPLLARLTFKDNLLDSVNHIFFNLFALVNPMTSSFSQCQTCRCHGIPLGDDEKNINFSCPITGCNLDTCDRIQNSVRVGEKTVLFLPSFHNSQMFKQITSPIDMTVSERVKLASLDEGLIMGTSFVVIPSPYHVIEGTSDDADQADLNSQIFRGLSGVLYSMDQGLICSSNCDLETMAEAAYRCYYVMQPSNNGSMLLRRVAGAEEVLRVPDEGLVDSLVNKEIENSVQACLLKINLTDYDPLLHEGGFHQKLNFLVKESLQSGSVFPILEGEFSELSSIRQPPSDVIGKAESSIDVAVVDKETLPLDVTSQDDKTIACITEEWKQLVVNEDPKLYSPSCTSKALSDQPTLSPRVGNRQLDRETYRILERLEVPRPLKAKAASPVLNENCMKNASVPVKKPLVPCQPNQGTQEVSVGSQLMKPNFQKQKRKHR